MTLLPIAGEDRGCAPDLTLHSRFHHVMRWQRTAVWGDVYVWECRLRFLVTFSFIYCVCKWTRGGERTTVGIGALLPPSETQAGPGSPGGDRPLHLLSYLGPAATLPGLGGL